MKNLLLLFAFLIFPLQTTWAAVDAYCQQEIPISSQMCIDYTAQAHQESDNEDNKAGLSSLTTDVDCTNCNAGSTALFSISGRLPLFSGGCPPHAWEQRHVLSVFIERPERPQWLIYSI
ncbi:hypothetical protein RY831_24010 [Noviherbaspirillum sp. CPCC 100848]|uniref:DUF2946 domain-containing protein n=1 Tax=Noviherbaspirillum album TaxID=3080276 RepID=A0ABU6JFB5_9BURK|nr:hypothetical protein [Noviherbaspirillum sp. CPCC 100848]MEC4722233.1 hypothetical protein [Noviherbaspirillum sp. CPCC 100848]